MMDCDIAYYEYYDCQMSDHVTYVSESGHEHYCVYYVYTPKDAEVDASTPVLVHVTHGGGVADEEKALALNCAAGQDTQAVIIVPWTDRPDGVCAALEDAKNKMVGKGNFDAICAQGTSSGGTAIIRIALESVNPKRDYTFRFATVCAYDPAKETGVTKITGREDDMKRLAEKGTRLFIQTDNSPSRGSSGFCNQYAKEYSEAGGTAIVAEIEQETRHEGKFTKPITHNSMNWLIGRGMLIEDKLYSNKWYVYQEGEKKPSTLKEATAILVDETFLKTGEVHEKLAS